MKVAKKFISLLFLISILIPSITFAENNNTDIYIDDYLTENKVKLGDVCLPVEKMAVELGSQGKWFTPGRDSEIKYIVLHSTESPQEEGYAEKVADWLSKTDYKASTHFIVGPDKILQTVDLYDTAWGVGSEANSYSIQIEMLGYAHYDRDKWLDLTSSKMLCRVSYLIAILAKQYEIPIRKVENAGVIDQIKGVAGHYVFSETLGGSDHTDPGENFPWDIVLAQASKYYNDVYYTLSEDSIKPDVPSGLLDDSSFDFLYNGELPNFTIFETNFVN